MVSDRFLAGLKSVLQKRQRKTLGRRDLRPAAVLVPFFKKGGDLFLLLTQRSETLERHQGQIAFPGGCREIEDGDLFQTALRESEEEIGLDRDRVELIGLLDDQETVTGFAISPFVATIPYPYPFQLDFSETAGLIEVPFSFFGNPDHCRHQTVLIQERPRSISYYHYEGHRIWGATAEIIERLVKIVPKEMLAELISSNVLKGEETKS